MKIEQGMLEDIQMLAIQLSRAAKQTVGEKRDYYITPEQLEVILKGFYEQPHMTLTTNHKETIKELLKQRTWHKATALTKDQPLLTWEEAEKLAEASHQAGAQAMVERIRNLKPAPLPIEKYLEKVKNGNKDDMFDYGYETAKEDMLSSLTNPDMSEK